MIDLFIVFVSNLISFSPFIYIMAVLTALTVLLLVRGVIKW